MRNHPSFHPSLQQGMATLLISLFMLLVLTIIGVTAIKISSLDTLIAGNEQQQMMLFQETETRLKQLAHIGKLKQAYGESGFTGNVDAQTFRFEDSASWPGFSEQIRNMELDYPCEQQGEAMSLGPSTPQCQLYDFRVKSQKPGSGVRDRHHRGGGKMAPAPGSKGSLL